ncbi:MAG: ABC transporter permease [Thermoprotei archaeon]|nr:MAG: ABC transporter permease [Thermoprotei archaeon]
MTSSLIIELGHLLNISIKAGTPLLLASLGEVYAERSGVLNLGLEGIMLIGAATGFIVAYSTGCPELGVLAAIVAGAIIGLLHAFVCISLQANQVVAGLALVMVGTGLSSLMARDYVGIALKRALRPVKIPGLSRIPIIGEGFFHHDILVYASYFITLILWFIMYKTKYGIWIRAVGEDPSAADAMGVNVYLVRYICTTFGGAMAGLAGAHISLAYTPMWVEGITVGRGWIALALVIFAMWDPLRAMIGAYLFGTTEVLQYWLQMPLQAMGIDPSLLGTFPYVATIIVLLVGSFERIRKRIGAPASLGKPYVRGF